MDRSQTEELILKIQGRWPNTKLKIENAEEWAEVLQNVTLAQAEKALDAYGMDGKSYAPGVYEIKARIQQAPRQEKSNPEQSETFFANAEKAGLRILAYQHNKGFAWRLVPAHLAVSRGNPAKIRIEGIDVEAYLEN